MYDFALDAKSVRTCKLGQKGIWLTPKAIWNGQVQVREGQAI